MNKTRPQAPVFRHGVNDKNRGAHGDSSFMLDGLPSSSENTPALAVGSVKSNNEIRGKSVFACPICKKQIEMDEAVYMADNAECFGGGSVAHYFCVIDSLQRAFELTHKVVKIHLNECDNAESLVLRPEHTAAAANPSDAYLYGLLGLEVEDASDVPNG